MAFSQRIRLCDVFANWTREVEPQGSLGRPIAIQGGMAKIIIFIHIVRVILSNCVKFLTQFYVLYSILLSQNI